MTLEAPKPIERGITQESLIITPEALYADNQSIEARELSAKWEEHRNKGNLWAVVACGDARVMIPKPGRIISIRSIFEGGKKEGQIFVSPGVEFVPVISHIDGETIVHGKRPSGCGGSAEKEKAINGSSEKPIEGIRYYVENNIQHPDPIIQAALSARDITRATGKPSIAIVQDHLTTKAYPFATFFPKGHRNSISSDLDWVSLVEGYNEKEIYANGLPELDSKDLPEFVEFLDACEEQTRDILSAYPNLKEMQKVQNPRMVIISSKLPSVRTRYPRTTRVPGSIFKLHMPREKNGSKIEITGAMQREIIYQAQYPLGHSVEHNGKPGEPFSKTDRVLIETSDINASRNLAAELAKRPWMKEWLELPDHHIIVIQNVVGISNLIEQFA